jgi:hypothetical protein
MLIRSSRAMAGAVKPALRAIFTLRSSGVVVVQAWRSLSG